MHILVDPDDRKPIYQQVVEGIRDLIARGALAEGSVLPPVRQLAGDLGVNLNTIATAYRELASEGLLSVRHGLRAVVTSRTTSAAERGDLRKPLRAALANLVLSGLPAQKILSLVMDELNGLLKGAK